MFVSKDQLVNFLIKGEIHLSKKDYGFFSNLQKQVRNNRPITSNQNKLFTKLLFKYKRQLTKLDYDVDALDKLIWCVEVVPSKDDYLCAKISVEGNNLVIQCPYNIKFIQKFKSVNDNYFIWNKQNKCYLADFSTHNLKIAYYELNKYFSDVRYDSCVENILNQIKQYKDCTLWVPTLVKVNGNFYISCINDSLNDEIKSFDLSDDPKILLKLSQYGVKIDKSITQNDELRQFASNFYATIDIDNLKEFSNWVKLLDYELIYIGSEIIFNKHISQEIKETFGDIHISRQVSDLDLYNNVLYVNYNSIRHNTAYSFSDNKRMHKNITKVVLLKNSRPVYVK